MLYFFLATTAASLYSMLRDRNLCPQHFNYVSENMKLMHLQFFILIISIVEIAMVTDKVVNFLLAIYNLSISK